MKENELSKILTNTLRECIKQDVKIYDIGGKKYKLVKKGKKWSRVEVK